jgi:predicted amidophosphoribosyltransferase
MPMRCGLLQRVRATCAQSGLDAAARAANLRDAFQVAQVDNLPRHVALLDDVLTTGHTAQAAAAALRAAGVEYIEVWCCARAQRHDARDYGV